VAAKRDDLEMREGRLLVLVKKGRTLFLIALRSAIDRTIKFLAPTIFVLNLLSDQSKYQMLLFSWFRVYLRFYCFRLSRPFFTAVKCEILCIFLGKFYRTPKILSVLVHQITKLIVKCVIFLRKKLFSITYNYNN